MLNSPKVVVVNMFTPSFKNLNNKYPTKDKVHSSTMNMFDYYADNKKKAFFMLDYFQGKFGKDKEINIMFENGEYATKDEKEKNNMKNILQILILKNWLYLFQKVILKKMQILKNLKKIWQNILFQCF